MKAEELGRIYVYGKVRGNQELQPNGGRYEGRGIVIYWGKVLLDTIFTPLPLSISTQLLHFPFSPFPSLCLSPYVSLNIANPKGMEKMTCRFYFPCHLNILSKDCCKLVVT